MLAPAGLHMERAFSIYIDPVEWPVVMGLVLAGISAVVIFRSCRKAPHNLALSWGLLWFFVVHGPDSGILIPMNSLFLEHWMYLPMIGLLLGLAETTAQACAGRPKFLGYGVTAAALVFALMLSEKTFAQNKIWHDGESFYTNIFAYHELSARAHNNLALYYTAHERYDEADAQFREATRISDSYAETRYNMAINDLRISNKEHIDRALADLDRALEIDPHFFRAWQLKGDIYAKFLSDPQKAEENYARAKMEFQPSPPQ
jgi:tetratricopeptide (TPR) repeat protein